MDSLVTLVTFLALPWVYLLDLLARLIGLPPEFAVPLILAGLTALNLRKPYGLQDNLKAVLGLILPFVLWYILFTIQGNAVGFSNGWIEPLAILSILLISSLIGFTRYRQTGQGPSSFTGTPLFWGCLAALLLRGFMPALGK